MESVTPEQKRRGAFLACATLMPAATAALAIWALTMPHRPLEYMVAGTLATAISLGSIFWALLRANARAARKTGPRP
jgi:hypothetical protein